MFKEYGRSSPDVNQSNLLVKDDWCFGYAGITLKLEVFSKARDYDIITEGH